MKSIHTEICIEASPEEVWNILMDFTAYHSWNPFVRSITGDQTAGQSLVVAIQPPGKKPMTFRPTVLTNEYAREFRWVGHLLMPGIFDGEHFFQLQPYGNGGTRLIHGERFRGILSGPLFNQFEEATTQGFNAMNHALKELAERELVQKLSA